MPNSVKMLIAASTLAALIAVIAASAFGADVVQTLTWKVIGHVSKHKVTPAGLDVTETTATSDGSVPPVLKTATVEFDKAGILDTKGLPTCRPAKLENTNAPQARRACPTAILGKGNADAKVVFPDQAPLDAPAPVTVFNGTPIGGRPNFLIHAYTTVPAPTTFVVPGKVVRDHGKFSYKITFQVPPIAGGYGSLVLFHTKVKRTWTYKGKKHSYISGKCPHSGSVLIQGTFHFADGQQKVSTGTAKY